MSTPDYPSSWYAATANNAAHYPALEDTLAVDVCVIGAGYTGLSAALHLAKAGYQVVVLESEKVGWGASGRNGGQLGTGQRLEQDELEEKTDSQSARLLWDIAEESKQTVKDLIKDYAIDCDLRPGILHAAHKPSLAASEKQYVEKLQSEYDYHDIRTVDEQEMCEMLATKAYFGGSLDMGAAHLHPLNFALGLANAAIGEGVRIFEKSSVVKIHKSSNPSVETALGRVNAKHVMIACNGYLNRLEPRIESKIMPINNFILATEPLGEELAAKIIRDDVAVADSKFVINYYRLSADRRLLFGGGENYSPKFPQDIGAFVRRYMLKIYPQLSDTRIDYAWGGALAITINRMPHIGRLESEVYFAQGFSGHGVGMATMAGKLAAEAIAGTAERFDVFSTIPSPSFPGGRYLRYPGLVAGMLYYSLRDRL